MNCNLSLASGRILAGLDRGGVSAILSAKSLLLRPFSCCVFFLDLSVFSVRKIAARKQSLFPPSLHPFGPASSRGSTGRGRAGRPGGWQGNGPPHRGGGAGLFPNPFTPSFSCNQWVSSLAYSPIQSPLAVLNEGRLQAGKLYHIFLNFRS